MSTEPHKPLNECYRAVSERGQHGIHAHWLEDDKTMCRSVEILETRRVRGMVNCARCIAALKKVRQGRSHEGQAASARRENEIRNGFGDEDEGDRLIRESEHAQFVEDLQHTKFSELIEQFTEMRDGHLAQPQHKRVAVAAELDRRMDKLIGEL